MRLDEAVRSGRAFKRGEWNKYYWSVSEQLMSEGEMGLTLFLTEDIEADDYILKPDTKEEPTKLELTARDIINKSNELMADKDHGYHMESYDLNYLLIYLGFPEAEVKKL